RLVPTPERLRERRVRAAAQEGGQGRHRLARAGDDAAGRSGGVRGAEAIPDVRRPTAARRPRSGPGEPTEVPLLHRPPGPLDLKLRKQMQLELKRIQEEVGITFIYVTHDQEEAMTMSNRFAVMRHGKIEQIGPPEEVYESPATEFVAGFLGASNLLDGELAGSH